MKQTWANQLDVSVCQAEGYPCLRIQGEGDPNGAKLLEGYFNELLNRGYVQVILDARDLRFLDQACCQTLESMAERLQEEGGCLVVVDQSLPVERSLKLLGLDKSAHVFPTVRQAAAYLGWHK